MWLGKMGQGSVRPGKVGKVGQVRQCGEKWQG